MELYFTLQVPVFSSIPDVSNAFRKLALRHHPDKAVPSQKNVFDAIVHAHDILSCEDSKHNYDLLLRARLADGEVLGFEEPVQVNMLRIKSNVLPKLDEYKMYFIAYLQCADRLRLNQCKEEREERKCNLTLLLLSKWNLETNCQHSFEDCEIPFERAVSASTEAAIAAGCCTPNLITNGTTCHLLRCVLNKQVCATCFLIHVHHEKNGSSELHFAIKSLISKLLIFQLVTQFDLYNIICKILLLLQNAAAKNYVLYLRLLGTTFRDLYKDAMKSAYQMKFEFELEEDFDSILKNVRDETFSDQIAKGTLPIYIYNVVSAQKKLQKSLTSVLFINDGANKLRKLAFDVLQRDMIQPLEIHKVSSGLLACALFRGSTMRPSDPKARRATEMVLLMVCRRIAQWSVQSSSSWFTTYACFHALRFVNSLETVPFQEMKAVIDMLESGLEHATQYFYWCPRELMLSFLDICDQFAFFQTRQTQITSVLASERTTCEELKISHRDVLLQNHKTSLTSTTTVKQCGKNEHCSRKDADSDDDGNDDDNDHHIALWNSRDDQRMSLIESVLASLGWNMVDYVANFSSDCHYQLQNSSRFWSFGMDLSIPLYKNPTAKLYTALHGFEFNAETAQLTLRQEVFDSQKHAAWQLAYSSVDVKEMLSLFIHQTSFSLDPISKDLEFAPFQQMVVAPKRISGSEYEKAQFAADYWLKALINGATVQMAPPFRTRRLSFDQLPDGLKTILETYHKNSTPCLSRFWIECEEVPSLDDNPVIVTLRKGQPQLKDELRVIQEQQRTTIKYTLGEPVMVVKTRDMEWVNGQLQDVNDGKTETPWDIFVTDNLETFEKRMQSKPSIRSMVIMSPQNGEDDFFGLSKRVKIWFYEHGQISKIYQTVTIPSRFREFVQYKQIPISHQEHGDLYAAMFSRPKIEVSKCEQVAISCAQSTQEFVEFVCRHCKRNTYYSANQQLAFQLTKYYDTFAQYFPAWNRLKQLAKISTAVHEVEKMRLYQRHYMEIFVAQRDKHCFMDDDNYQEYSRLNSIATHHQKVLQNIASIVPDFADKDHVEDKTHCNLVPAVQLQNKTRFINGGVRLAPSVRLQSDAEFAMNNLLRYPYQSTFSFNSACNNAKQVISELYSASTFASPACDVSGIRNLMRSIQFTEESARKTRAMQQDNVPLKRDFYSACGAVPFATPSFSSKPPVPFSNQCRADDPLRFVFSSAHPAAPPSTSSSSVFRKRMGVNNTKPAFDFMNTANNNNPHPFLDPFSPDFINIPIPACAPPATKEQKLQDAQEMMKVAKEKWNDMVSEMQEAKKKVEDVVFPILAEHPPQPAQRPPNAGVVPRRSYARPESVLPQDVASGAWTKRTFVKNLGPGEATYSLSRESCGSLLVDLHYLRAQVGQTATGQRQFAKLGENPPSNGTLKAFLAHVRQEMGTLNITDCYLRAEFANPILRSVFHHNLPCVESGKTLDSYFSETFILNADPKPFQRPPSLPLFQVTPSVLSKLLYDPKIVRGVEHAIKFTSSGMTIVAAGVDTSKVISQILDDMESGNFHGSVVTTAGVVGGWSAAFAGAKIGLKAQKHIPSKVPPLVRVVFGAGATMTASYFAYHYGEKVAEEMIDDFVNDAKEKLDQGAALIFNAPFDWIYE